MDEKELTTLLEQWEGVFKKGLLTFWVLLLLHERPMYVFEMGEYDIGPVVGYSESDHGKHYMIGIHFGIHL